MPVLTRRTVIEGMGAAGLLAVAPSAATGLVPEPPLDIEAWLGPRLMADIKRNYELGKINVPEKYRFRPPLLTPEWRFNISASFRYALAKLLNEGPDVLCPDEPGLHDQYRSVLRKAERNVGIPVKGLIGELRDQPGKRMILLTRDRYVMLCPRAREHIEPFSRYQWLGWLDRFGFITPERNPPPRSPDEPVPLGRAPTAEELWDGKADPRALGRLPPKPPPPPEFASPDRMMTVTLRIADAVITAHGPETVLGARGYYLPELEEKIGPDLMAQIRSVETLPDGKPVALTDADGRFRISTAYRLSLTLLVNGCRSVEITEPLPDADQRAVRQEALRLLNLTGLTRERYAAQRFSLPEPSQADE